MENEAEVTRLRVVFREKNSPKSADPAVYYDLDDTQNELEVDEMMEDAMEKGWLHFFDVDGEEHWISLDGVDEVSF